MRRSIAATRSCGKSSKTGWSSTPSRVDSTDAWEWLAYAESDATAMGVLGEAHLRQAAFLLQQAAEKALKALLVAHGVPLRKTHDLEVLLEYVLEVDASMERHRGLCEDVTLAYVGQRYPSMDPWEPTVDEFRANVGHLHHLMGDVRERLRSMA